MAKGKLQTKEQESRDDWPRAWKWISRFADCDPSTIIPDHFLRNDPITGEVKGLMIEIEREISSTERHRVIKVWRTFFKQMAAHKFLPPGSTDPSKAIKNSAPDPRQATWERREVLAHVDRAWELGYFGLAACIAVAWDSMLSPIDARRLTHAQAGADAQGIVFWLGRAKTGRAAAGTLTPWSEAILSAYLEKLGAEPARNAPIFRTRGSKAGPKGGRPRPSVPYTKDTLGDDFRVVRSSINPNETRQLADMRRSGAVEGDAGGGSLTDQSSKMANTISANNRLRKTYNPVNVASVRRYDEARAVGAKLLEQRPDESVTSAGLVTLLQGRQSRK
jgi:hypothetical protein